MSTLELNKPYLVFLGDAVNPLDAKTGHGIAHWRPEDCVGQLRYANCKVDTGLPDLDIGQAPAGGHIEPEWISTLTDALNSGLDVVSGLHEPLANVPGLANTAARSGSRLVEVRVPPPDIPVASGAWRPGKRVLMVGTDCCTGKKYTALALHRAMRINGMNATFRATGQTGILIAGSGIPIDAVVADFLPGAAELISPANDPDHWDVIEGQGSLFHPAYAAVSLGLLHGSQPDALVLCHDAMRAAIDDWPDFPIAPLAKHIERNEEAARLTNPWTRCIGVSINTSSLDAEERREFLDGCRHDTGLPCVDPLIDDVAPLVEALHGIGRS
ncbi:MAG: DUF1611 domain-containing protein [Xanthomonadales bacterium]|nr:DUF1611 domain-containing protein [Xanthomonadales bacterium]NIX14024.1 DUF1611 domain-containing protein [Xanthomonadales bacterium]